MGGEGDRTTSGSGSAEVRQTSAIDRDYEGLVVSTDPPYHDNIGYADLSDFFYIWLRRSLRSVYPSLLATVLTPKSAELVANPYRFDGDRRKTEEHFERGFGDVFRLLSRNARSDTPITIFYAFKQSEATEDAAGDSADGISTPPPPLVPGPPPPVIPKNRRFYGVAHLDAERYQRDFTKLAQEIVTNLAGQIGTGVEITVEIRATNDDGFPENIVRTVTENAATLKLDSYGFEKD